MIIRNVTNDDLRECFAIESACYTSDGASIEKIRKRIALFPKGFLVADLNGKIVGMINSGATDKEDITDEDFKDMIGHKNDGNNIVIFSLAVMPEFQGNGISTKLLSRFIETSKNLKKGKILLICKSDLVQYYKDNGFMYGGESNSAHGGFKWHEMHLKLQDK